jgi:formylglycine-generating enzyme required for sulfatase activity
LVDITYDVAADFPTVSVSLQVSSDGGSTFSVPATTLSGAIGAGVTTGTAKTITWDAGADWSGQYSTQMCFKVIADDGNSAPTISDIAAQTITEGGNTGALAFTIGDDQTAADSLTLSGSSSNTTLVPNANIVFGGSGANRTVTVTPASSQTGTATITVTVSDGSLTSSDTFVLTVNSAGPAGMALIPQGSFTMGDALDGVYGAPTRTVTLDAFYMGKYEVTKAEWDEVRTWGLSNGYTDLSAGSGKASNYPLQEITWYDMVKWCNARSEKEGFTPVYYTDDAQMTIYKTGSVNVTNAQVKWTTNGYRLPTEAEWEKAARGGLSGKRFPWGDTISYSQANYNATNPAVGYSYDLSGEVSDYHPTYATGSFPFTSPVGAFAANGYGLYDMAGNVWEGCWDWYETYASGSQTNPRGSTSGSARVVRGGGWNYHAAASRVATRSGVYPNDQFSFLENSIGFRVVRSSAPDTPPDIGGGGNPGLNTAPTISDIADRTINQDGNTGELDFTIGDAETAATSLTLSGSSSNTTLVPNGNIVFSGSGANRTVTVTPASGQAGTATITVTVSDGSLSSSDTFVLTVNYYAAPAGMALIPAGAFMMGNSVEADTDITDAPTRTVTLDAFYMGKYEVTKAEWDEVRTWGLSNGYTDLAAGSGKVSNHPVQSIDWYQMVKWCNARSQKEGLTPVYYTNDVQTTIYKTGSVNVTNAQVKWSANGYRLPTEAEWEKAARGGLSGKRFSWGDTISHAQANYFASSSLIYDLGGSVINYHPTYEMWPYPYTSPVGAFAANGYGLYDMAGNVREWCWDWYGTYASGSQTNPRGPTTGSYRVIRGGYWYNNASYCRVANRNFSNPPLPYDTIGFRVVRSSDPDNTATPPEIGGDGNSPPTISDIADQTINEDSYTGELAFTIGDAQTAVGSLTLTGKSSNTTLVPNANIVFGGSGANRTVTVVPASSQTGTVIITVTVSDGSLSASDTLVLTVNANISDIADQTITAGSNTGALAFTVGVGQTVASSLTLGGSSSNTALVPNANIVFGGSGANRTVTVTPVSGQSGTAKITVTVSDGELSASYAFVLTVTGMVLIPQGAFTMGDSLDGLSDAPARIVTLDAFYIGKYEVTKAEWDEVYTWALSNGYHLASGYGKAGNHPVETIYHFNMLKWCNARSEKEGLTPVYYTNDEQTTIFKTGSVDVTNAQVKWAANGYRLPTEAEWEKAARGGLSGKRFPWGDTISHSLANYNASGSSYDLSGSVNNFHPTYATGDFPYTSPVGAFAANGYGLYDMAGNVSEWCWDRYGTYAAGSLTNPRGATLGGNRVYRGGRWFGYADDCRVAYREYVFPSYGTTRFGFRVVRSSVP